MTGLNKNENMETNSALNTFLQNIHPEDFAESGVKLILQIEPDETAKQRIFLSTV